MAVPTLPVVADVLLMHLLRWIVKPQVAAKRKLFCLCIFTHFVASRGTRDERPNFGDSYKEVAGDAFAFFDS